MWQSLRFSAAIYTLVVAFGIAEALRMPIRRDDSPHSTSMNFSNAADPFNFGFVNQAGDGQVIYVATITVDGQDFEVQLDTGSSDLWLDTTNITFKNAQNTQIQSSVTYGDTTQAAGDVLLAEVKFGDFTVSNQAFISAVGTNATSDGDKGLLGIGPPLLSVISDALVNSSFNGASLLENIFSIYPNESNFMTFQLTRSDLGMTDGGVFTIGEVDSNLSAITSAPQLDVFAKENQWVALMDAVVVNGQRLTGHGIIDTVKNPPAEFQGKLLSLLDSGSSLGNGPPFYIDAIYKNLPGAQPIDNAPGFYTLPCDTKINVSMVFNGQEYPIHPLDMTRVETSDDNTTTVCWNTIAYANPNDQRQDFILGDAFLRNVYSLFDFGNYTTANDGKPFIQLLSLTDKDKAWAEFDTLNNARIKQWKSIMIDKTSSIPSSPSSTSTSDLNSSISSTQDDFNSLMRNSYIVIGLLAGVIVLLLLVIISMLVAGKKSGGKGYKAISNPGGGYQHGKGFTYETPYDS